MKRKREEEENGEVDNKTEFVQLSKDSYITRRTLDIDSTTEEFNQLLRLRPERQDKIKIYGRVSDVPRYQKVFGDFSYSFSGLTLEPELTIPSLVQKCIGYMKKRYPPEDQWTGALVNWYMDGRQYIGPHSDDERDLVAGAPIGSFSFGATRTFRVTVKDHFKKQVYVCKRDFELKHGTVVVMHGNMQKEFKHQIPCKKKEAGVRINVTVRAFVGNKRVKTTT